MKYRIRILDSSDYDRNYINLMSQLSPLKVQTITKLQFASWVELVKQNHNHCIFVIENIENDLIIASGTLLIEPKLIHNFGFVGHIEDIVVDKSYRGIGLGKLIISYLVEHAKHLKCYKVILNSRNEHIKYYKKLGFNKKDTSMSIYFES